MFSVVVIGHYDVTHASVNDAATRKQIGRTRHDTTRHTTRHDSRQTRRWQNEFRCLLTHLTTVFVILIKCDRNDAYYNY